jgi:subtilase family serine protease
VTNAGTGPAAASTALVQADPGLARTTTVAVPALAAGASAALTGIVGPAENCFDPDCTVRVTADSTSVVAESNEANNVDERTSIG